MCLLILAKFIYSLNECEAVTEEKKLRFRLNIFTRFKTSCYICGQRGLGALNLDIPNFNIEQTSDQ